MILDPDAACDLILRIRRPHAKKIAEPDGADGSNDIDDGMDDVLVEGLDSGNSAEIARLIEGLQSEQLKELIGRFLFRRDPDDFEILNEAKAAARDSPTPLIAFIESDPACAEYLAGGLETLGVICAGPSSRSVTS